MLDLAGELGSTALSLSKGPGFDDINPAVFRSVLDGYVTGGGALPPPGPSWFVRNVHLDLRPDDDQQTEVRQLERLGARRINIGQADVTCVVMTDPEGNEFCVLRSLAQKDKDTAYNNG